MADHLSESFEKSAMTNEEKRSHKAEIRKQIVAFALMFFLTFLAFAAVATDFVPRTLAIPFILYWRLCSLPFSYYSLCI